jgi:hypothetical protein
VHWSSTGYCYVCPLGSPLTNVQHSVQVSPFLCAFPQRAPCTFNYWKGKVTFDQPWVTRYLARNSFVLAIFIDF